jgi:glutamate formiminotransferase/formiminotetrahydrofolate cyclodeaminase
MAECVEIARRLGKRVGEELDIPVYLYEQAATSPDRKNLENLRRGQYEGLKIEIETNPERAPDFGPARLGPAGATVIGARPFLIAYNVYLTTGEVAIAEKIARAIRHSSGGLRYVKALGLLVDGRAQVSMNLTDFRKTPVGTVQEMIRREAARYGVGVHHSELVGLIPEDALVDAAIWYLQLDQFHAEQILEKHLHALQTAEVAQETVYGTSFLDALAAGTAAPGGGSAAAYAGSMAAALVAMVARLTIGKKKYAPVEAQMKTILERAEELRSHLATAVQDDASAYQAVMATFQMPRTTPDEISAFQAAIESATLKAAQVPLEVARMVVEVLNLASKVVEHGNLNAISDGGSAAALAAAALKGAGLNVRINIASLEDKALAADLIQQIQHLDQLGLGLQNQIQATLAGRGGLSSV